MTANSTEGSRQVESLAPEQQPKPLQPMQQVVTVLCALEERWEKELGEGKLKRGRSWQGEIKWIDEGKIKLNKHCKCTHQEKQCKNTKENKDKSNCAQLNIHIYMEANKEFMYSVIVNTLSKCTLAA